MKIQTVEVMRVSVPFTETIEWASGRREGTSRLLVRVETDEGIVGWGETFAHVFVEAVLKNCIPLVIGVDPHDIEYIHGKIEGAGFYHHKRASTYASCAIEMACWDIIGKAAGEPLFKLLGGKLRSMIPCAAYLLNIGSPETMARQAEQYKNQGYKTIKVKIGKDRNGDIAIVDAIRGAIGPDVELRVDVNGAWTVATAKRQLKKLEKYDLEYVEQPVKLEDLQGLAELRRMSKIPIAVDESAFTDEDVLSIITTRAADVILIDPHEAGGLWEAKKEAAIAEAAGIPVGIHRAGELGISKAALLHLVASTPNMFLAIDDFQILSDDITKEQLAAVDGYLIVPEGPGLGVEVDGEKLARYQSDIYYSPYLNQRDPNWFPQKPAY